MKGLKFAFKCCAVYSIGANVQCHQDLSQVVFSPELVTDSVLRLADSLHAQIKGHFDRPGYEKVQINGNLFKKMDGGGRVHCLLSGVRMAVCNQEY